MTWFRKTTSKNDNYTVCAWQWLNVNSNAAMIDREPVSVTMNDMSSPTCPTAAECSSVVPDIVQFCLVSVVRQRPCEAVNDTIQRTSVTLFTRRPVT